jgi:nitrite reductase/ring-hydroxylating ferredoxin subunit
LRRKVNGGHVFEKEVRAVLMMKYGGKSMSFVEVAQVDQVLAGGMKPFAINGKDIVLVNYQGNYYAIGRKCTHAEGDLSNGKLEGKIVTCPVHGSKFDVTTGISISGPKIGFLRIRTKSEPVYEVRVDGRSIKIDI